MQHKWHEYEETLIYKLYINGGQKYTKVASGALNRFKQKEVPRRTSITPLTKHSFNAPWGEVIEAPGGFQAQSPLK